MKKTLHLLLAGLLAMALPGTEAAPAHIEPPGLPAQSRMAGTEALDKLVARTTPAYASRISFRLDPKSSPVITGAGSGIRITAPSISECARAYGYYLRKVAHIHLSWNGDNASGAEFIVPTRAIKIPPALPCNFAFNYCTLSYTCVHWDKAKWARELDRLAMNGYKYVLVTSGLEKVWQGFLTDLDYPADKIARFIPAPPYAAWWGMGNLEGEGGPISQNLIDREAGLGRFIVQRCNELGMNPVLQGYVGLLPHDFPADGINGTILPQGKWCGYERPAVLEPTSPAFPHLAELWYKHLHQVYGTTAEGYGGDLFLEGGRMGGLDLTAAAKAVQNAMQKASPGSTWFIQAWGSNPAPQWLAGTDQIHTVILYLDQNMSATTPAARDFGGRSHVWCGLANFGGRHGLSGGFRLLMGLADDANGAVGLGLLSERLETDPLYYALFHERLNTRQEIQLGTYIKDISRARYGRTDEDIAAYIRLLADSVYKPDNACKGCLENIQAAHPDLNAKRAASNPDGTPYYAPAKVEEAARHLLAAGEKAGTALTALPTYRYDLADICRLVIADRARTQLAACRKAFDRKDLPAFRKGSAAFLALMDDAAAVLATCPDFLLGTYLQGALNRAGTPEDKRQMERNIRALLTTWQPGSSSPNGYANREYAELMSHYYKPRWQAYFRDCEAVLNGEGAGKKRKAEAMEPAFPGGEIPMLTTPQGDIMELARKLLKP